MVRNLCKKALKDFAVPWAKDFLPELATKETSPILDKFEGKIRRQGAVRVGKGFTLFIPNEDMDDVIKKGRVTRKFISINGRC